MNKKNETKDKRIEYAVVVIEARKEFFNREIRDSRYRSVSCGLDATGTQRKRPFSRASLPERSISAFLSNLVARQREHDDRGSINIRESPETHL